MQKLILNICILLGNALAMIAKPMNGRRLSFLRYTVCYSFYTALYKGRFKDFGQNSKLVGAPDELKMAKNISIGSYCRLGRHLLLRCYHISDSAPKIVIGSHVNIGDYSTVSCCNRIIIEDGVRLGRMIMITDNAHGHTNSIEELRVSPIDRPLVSKGPVVIERNVWIGEKATILPGVKIGEGAIIAANAVVTRDIPPFSVAAGCPARVIRTVNT